MPTTVTRHRSPVAASSAFSSWQVGCHGAPRAQQLPPRAAAAPPPADAARVQARLGQRHSDRQEEPAGVPHPAHDEGGWTLLILVRSTRIFFRIFRIVLLVKGTLTGKKTPPGFPTLLTMKVGGCSSLA